MAMILMITHFNREVDLIACALVRDTLGWKRKMEHYYSNRLAALVVLVLDHYCSGNLPEAITWLLPVLKEALFSTDDRYQKWITDILAYVARECGVPLPQEEEHERAS